MSDKCLLSFQYGSRSVSDETYIFFVLGLIVGVMLWKNGLTTEAVILGTGIIVFGHLRSTMKKLEPEFVRIFEKGMYFPTSCVETKSFKYDRDVYDNYNLVGIISEKIDDNLDINLSPEKRTDFTWNEIRKVQYNPGSIIFILKGGDIVIIQYSLIPKQHKKTFISLVKEFVEKTGGIISKES